MTSEFLHFGCISLRELSKLCASDDLSLTTLTREVDQLLLRNRKIVEALTQDGKLIIGGCHGTREVYKYAPFFHQICMNKKVTLEMVYIC